MIQYFLPLPFHRIIPIIIKIEISEDLSAKTIGQMGTTNLLKNTKYVVKVRENDPKSKLWHHF